MSKRKARAYIRKHCACQECRLFYTEEDKRPCIKKHPLNVMVRLDIVLKAIDIATQNTGEKNNGL